MPLHASRYTIVVPCDCVTIAHDDDVVIVHRPYCLLLMVRSSLHRYIWLLMVWHGLDPFGSTITRRSPMLHDETFICDVSVKPNSALLFEQADQTMWLLMLLPVALSLPMDTTNGSSSSSLSKLMGDGNGSDAWKSSRRRQGVWCMIVVTIILLCVTEPSLHHQLAVRPANGIVPIPLTMLNAGAAAAAEASEAPSTNDNNGNKNDDAGATPAVGMEEITMDNHATDILLGYVHVSECVSGTIYLFVGSIVAMIRRRWVKVYSTQFGVYAMPYTPHASCYSFIDIHHLTALQCNRVVFDCTHYPP